MDHGIAAGDEILDQGEVRDAALDLFDARHADGIPMPQGEHGIAGLQQSFAQRDAQLAAGAGHKHGMERFGHGVQAPKRPRSAAVRPRDIP